MLKKKLWLMVPLLAVVLISGCGREEIRVYRAPKDKAVAAPASSMAGTPDAPPMRPSLGWKTPAGWKELEPDNMRVASFSDRRS